MIRHSRLPKRKIQKQRDALFVENMLLKMQIAMLEVQAQCIIASKSKPENMESDGIVIGPAMAQISINTEKFKEILEITKAGPDAYEAKLPNPQ